MYWQFVLSYCQNFGRHTSEGLSCGVLINARLLLGCWEETHYIRDVNVLTIVMSVWEMLRVSQRGFWSMEGLDRSEFFSFIWEYYHHLSGLGLGMCSFFPACRARAQAAVPK